MIAYNRGREEKGGALSNSATNHATGEQSTRGDAPEGTRNSSDDAIDDEEDLLPLESDIVKIPGLRFPVAVSPSEFLVA